VGVMLSGRAPLFSVPPDLPPRQHPPDV